MTEELFRDYWWLIFPLFGMAMALWGSVTSERRSNRALDVIKAYVDQGKEPPAELLKLASQDPDGDAASFGPGNQNSRAWTFVTFAALAAGFATGYAFVRQEDYAFAFLIVAVVMSVLAVGALIILISSRRR